MMQELMAATGADAGQSKEIRQEEWFSGQGE